MDVVTLGLDIRRDQSEAAFRNVAVNVRGRAFRNCDVPDFRSRNRLESLFTYRLIDRLGDELLRDILQDLVAKPLTHDACGRFPRAEPRYLERAAIALRSPFDF